MENLFDPVDDENLVHKCVHVMHFLLDLSTIPVIPQFLCKGCQGRWYP